MSKARNLATLLGSNGLVKTEKYVDSVGGQSTFVASGALPNGKPIILNSNGTVSAVGNTFADETLTLAWPAGGYTTTSNKGPVGLDSDFNPNVDNQFVIVYGDNNNSNYTTCAVGTVSGTTITFGTPVVVVSAHNGGAEINFNPNRASQFLLFYQDNGDSYKRKLKVGTISGTTPSFGSATNVTTSYGNTSFRGCMEFDPFTTDKFIVFYQNNNNGPLEVRISTVNSGGTITLGSAVQAVASGSANYPSLTLDKNTANKFLITWRDANNDGAARAGTISGVTCSFGTSMVWDSANPYYIVTASEKGRSGKFLVASYDQPNSGRTQLRVLTVSGTTVTAGSPVNISNGPFYTSGIQNDPNAAGKFVLHGGDGNAPYGHKAYVVTVSGDVSSVSSVYDMTNTKRGGTAEGVICFDPNNNGKLIFGAGYSPSLGHGTQFAVTQLGGTYQGVTTNLTATNFIGIPSAAFADTASATVQLQGGIASNLSGLTAGATYYVKTDATFSTTAGTPSVVAGKALSATSILLKGI